MRRAARTDSNLKAIVKAARKLGFLVHVTNGDWDLTVQLQGRTELWEVKRDRKATHTPRQKLMLASGWRIVRVETVEDVINRKREMAG